MNSILNLKHRFCASEQIVQKCNVTETVSLSLRVKYTEKYLLHIFFPFLEVYVNARPLLLSVRVGNSLLQTRFPCYIGFSNQRSKTEDFCVDFESWKSDRFNLNLHGVISTAGKFIYGVQWIYENVTNHKKLWKKYYGNRKRKFNGKVYRVESPSHIVSFWWIECCVAINTLYFHSVKIRTSNSHNSIKLRLITY